MNTEQIAAFIDRPELLDAGAIETLHHLAQQYPYSSVYGLLYVSAVAKYQSISLDKALDSTAYRLSDRVRLYRIIQDATSISDPVAPTISIHPKEEAVPEVLDGTIAVATTISETSESEEVKQELAEQELTKEKIELPALKVEAEILPAIDINFNETTEAFSIEQDYFVALEKMEEEVFPEVHSDTEQQKIAIKEDAIVKVETTIEPTPIVETGPRSFTAWLKSGSDISNNTENKEIPVTPISKTSKQSIIDKFIETEPSISRPKSEFYSPSKKAKESLAESTIPISETLAKIFAAQGNYPKAIHVYHQLILSFPEKKSLFAVQIEELKKKITP